MDKDKQCSTKITWILEHALALLFLLGQDKNKGVRAWTLEPNCLVLNPGYTTSNYLTVALISHASKVMLKIIQARLQQYMNHEHPDVQVGLRKGRGTRDQIANIHWIIEKAKEFQKNIYFCFIDCAKAFDCVDHSKLWKSLKEIGIPDHLTCLLRNLYASQEAS